MATIREIAEADHIMGMHNQWAIGPSDDCGLCPRSKLEECPGCDKE